MLDRLIKIVLLCFLSTILGLISGSALWLVLRLIHLGTEAVWTWLPGHFSIGDAFPYYLIVGLTGGMLIGLWQKKFGLLPDNLEEVIGKIKEKGSYPYHHLPAVAVAAILPLIFGGAVGPEAGLSGIVAGLCCWAGDHLKYRGTQLAALAETGLAASLGVIFGSPLFGIVANLEPDDQTEHYRQKFFSKKTRIVLYCCGVSGGLMAMKVLGRIFGAGGGLPRFAFRHEIGVDQWKWFVPLLALGILFALYYQCIDHFLAFLRLKLVHILQKTALDHVLVSCLIAGLLVAVCGFFFPLSLFSGEHQLETLIGGWQGASAPGLFLSAAVKLFLLCACLNFGWKGGNIFPIIYSSALIGYGFALLTGMDGAFAVAVVTASVYAYILKKPATVIAVLLICFPISYILPLGISAIIASKIPSPLYPSAKKTSDRSAR